MDVRAFSCPLLLIGKQEEEFRQHAGQLYVYDISLTEDKLMVFHYWPNNKRKVKYDKLHMYIRETVFS